MVSIPSLIIVLDLLTSKADEAIQRAQLDLILSFLCCHVPSQTFLSLTATESAGNNIALFMLSISF